VVHRICVFCGSSPGNRPEYLEAARELGRTLAEKKLGLVYGGAKVGTMGALAKAARDAGGEVIGVIPSSIVEMEVADRDLSRLEVVATMHERKARMADLSDGFIALPGGLGTLDELSEVLAWAQLGMHGKPCGVLDVAGYFAGLLTLLDRAVADGFLHPEQRGLLLVETRVQALIDRMADYEPTAVDKGQWARSLAEGTR
jgi:uncharacterized protein (TIGR00730 family)